MAPKTEAAPATAAQRLDLARNETAALHAEMTKLDGSTALALLAGEPTDELHRRRAGIADRLGDLAILVRELERLVVFEERRAHLADLAAAHAKRQVLTRQADEQLARVKAAEQALEAATREHRRIRQEPDGVFSADQRLRRHRELHPHIDEASL